MPCQESVLRTCSAESNTTTVQKGKICQTCRRLIDRLPISEDSVEAGDDGKELGGGVRNLLAGISAQCYLCTAIWKGLPSHFHDEMKLRDAESQGDIEMFYQLRLDQKSQQGPGILEFYVTLHISEAPPTLPSVVSKLFVVHPASEIEGKVKMITSDWTVSDKSLDHVKTLLEECTTKHDACQRALSGPRLLPTRLIEVIGTTSALEVRLRDSSDLDPDTRYITLSHRWGSAEFVKLTKENQSKLKRSIRLDEMPKTFWDAVHFVHRLDVQYLWIDSLCIVQDSITDWQRESSMMHTVYSQSYLNLAATWAAERNVGLSYERPNLMTLNPPMVKLKRRRRMKRRSYWVVDNDMWNIEMEDAPLNRRGWVLQERLLSTRVLHFGKCQLLWECKMMDATEILPRGILPGRNSMTIKIKDLDPSKFMEQYWRRVSTEAFDKIFWSCILWTKIVEIYSEARLTYPRDKLVALSGIAKRMVPTMNSGYLAGLWREHLELQLLWHVVDSSKSHTREYRAPSWSWASRDGRICQPLIWTRGDTIARVVDVRVEPTTEDPFGTVKNGHLRLQGALKHIELEKRPLQYSETQAAWILKLCGDGPVSDHHDSQAQADTEVHLDSALVDQGKGCKLFIVPVYYNQTEQHLRGLLLSRGTNSIDYTRIGTFWTWQEANIREILDLGGITSATTRNMVAQLRHQMKVITIF